MQVAYMKAPSIRAVVVDDEPRAVAGLRSMLARHPDVSVLAEANSGRAAAHAIRAFEPDVVFLDIQMPGMDGVRVVEELPAERRPLVVFVTAHDDRAIDAYGLRAVDYLLKPVSDARLSDSLDRIRESLRLHAESDLHQRLRDLLVDDGSGIVRGPDVRYATQIAVRVGNRSVLVAVEDIDWIEADGFCSALHVGPKTHVIRETLLSIAARLDPTQFVRVHRSNVVNVGRIGELKHRSFNALTIVLRDGTELPVSRRRRHALLAVIGPSR